MQPITSIRAAVGALVALSPLSGQQTQGDFVAVAHANAKTNQKGALVRVDALAGAVTDLGATGALVDGYSVATDPYDDTVLWVGTRSPNPTVAPTIHKVVAVAGKIVVTTGLNVTLTSADSVVSQLRVWGHRLLFLTSTRLASVPLSGGAVDVIAKFDANTGEASDFACDGRNVFVHMQPTASILAEHIVRFDLENPQNTSVVYQCPGITHFLSSVTPDDQGNLLLTEFEVFSTIGELKLVDPQGKSLKTLKMPFTEGLAGARMDTANGVIVVAGRNFDTTTQRSMTGFVTLLNWTIFKTEFARSPEFFENVDVRRHEAIHRYGHVCSSTPTRRVEILASGLPAAGNGNYKLAVQGGLPNRAAMLLLGLHGASPVPFDLSIMGAGNCELGVVPLVSLGLALDGTGALLVPAPIPTAIQPVNVDAQWLVVDSGANRAGFVSSQVGSVVIR